MNGVTLNLLTQPSQVIRATFISEIFKKMNNHLTLVGLEEVALYLFSFFLPYVSSLPLGLTASRDLQATAPGTDVCQGSCIATGHTLDRCTMVGLPESMVNTQQDDGAADRQHKTNDTLNQSIHNVG